MPVTMHNSESASSIPFYHGVYSMYKLYVKIKERVGCSSTFYLSVVLAKLECSSFFRVQVGKIETKTSLLRCLR